jgi:hypothetical protein
MDDWTRDEDVYDLSYSEMVIIETACIFIPAAVFVTLHYKHGFALSLCYDDKQTVIENERLFCFVIFHFGVCELICCLHAVCYCFGI